jgi:hypothetical protein
LHLEHGAQSSASSAGADNKLANYLGASREHWGSLSASAPAIFPACRALRAAPALKLFLTDGCVSLSGARRSRGVASAPRVVRSVRIRRREPHRLNLVSIAAPVRQQRDAGPRRHAQAIHEAAALAETAGSDSRLQQWLFFTLSMACG